MLPSMELSDSEGRAHDEAACASPAVWGSAPRTLASCTAPRPHRWPRSQHPPPLLAGTRFHSRPQSNWRPVVSVSFQPTTLFLTFSARLFTCSWFGSLSSSPLLLLTISSTRARPPSSSTSWQYLSGLTVVRFASAHTAQS